MKVLVETMDSLARQASFLKNMKVLVETMDSLGNPFSYTSGDLLLQQQLY